MPRAHKLGPAPYPAVRGAGGHSKRPRATGGLCHSLGRDLRGRAHPGSSLYNCPFPPLRSNITDEPTLSSIRTAIEAYVDPYLGESLATAQAVRDMSSHAGGYVARIALGFPV